MIRYISRAALSVEHCLLPAPRFYRMIFRLLGNYLVFEAVLSLLDTHLPLWATHNNVLGMYHNIYISVLVKELDFALNVSWAWTIVGCLHCLKYFGAWITHFNTLANENLSLLMKPLRAEFDRWQHLTQISFLPPVAVWVKTNTLPCSRKQHHLYLQAFSWWFWPIC